MDLIYVYKIFSPICSDFYIGSTKDPQDRIEHHNKNLRVQNTHMYNYKLYETMRTIGTDWYFEVLEQDYVVDNEERRKLEQKWINSLKPTLNMRNAYSDKKMYDREWDRKNRSGGRPKHNEYRRQKIKCEYCAKEITRGSYASHKHTYHGT